MRRSRGNWPGKAQAELSIVTDDLSGNTVSVPLAPVSPGIYSANGSGAGQGAILINGTATLAAPAGPPYNGQPAKRGTDYINIFATGLGPVTQSAGHGSTCFLRYAVPNRQHRNGDHRQCAGHRPIRRSRARLCRSLSGERIGARDGARWRCRAGGA